MFSYFQFYLDAQTKYQIHSPFAYEFVMNILEDDRNYYFFQAIEAYRKQLSLSTQKLKFQNQNSTSTWLLKNRAIQAFWGQLLFKTVHHYKPNSILEIGTNLGISSLYLAKPDSSTILHLQVEEKEITNHLKKEFKKLAVPNIQYVAVTCSNFEWLSNLTPLDFVFFNDFAYAAKPYEYYKKFFEHTYQNSVFIFHKPYQNQQTVALWKKLKVHPKVQLSIDLFEISFLFFRSEQKESTHFKIIESWKKPWAFM